MKDLRATGGCGVVDGWSLTAACSCASHRMCGLRETDAAAWEPVDLLDHPALTDHARRWPARNQGHRSTCNAFAVVAAEELWHWRQTGSLAPLSEELLYRDMRARPVPLTDPAMTPDQIAAKTARAAAEGTTFLSQARDVLAAADLRPAADGPYEDDRGLRKNHVTARPATPATGGTGAQAWLHNIARDGDILGDVDWLRPKPGKPFAVSSFFHDRLSEGRPVVASFALPQGVGIGAFIGAEGRFAGLVSYPPADVLMRRDAQPVAGHSVCLLGFRPAPDGRIAEGRFLFRNSLGPVRQSAFAGRRGAGDLPAAPGYGWISVQDVETWCWEFLCRR